MTERSLASRQARRSKRGGTGRGVDRRQGLACRQRELTGDVRMELQRSPRQELLKGVGTGRLERDQELHVHAQVQTRSWNLPSAPHKSLFLAAVWIWVAARGNLSTKLWGVFFFIRVLLRGLPCNSSSIHVMVFGLNKVDIMHTEAICKMIT